MNPAEDVLETGKEKSKKARKPRRKSGPAIGRLRVRCPEPNCTK